MTEVKEGLTTIISILSDKAYYKGFIKKNLTSERTNLLMEGSIGNIIKFCISILSNLKGETSSFQRMWDKVLGAIMPEEAQKWI